MLPGRLGNALAGARGGHDHQAGFAAVFGRRRAADDLNGLNGVGGKLVGEDLALLIGDGLAIDGEGVGCVVAETMEQAVGVGRYAGVVSVTRELSVEDWLSSGTLMNRSRSTSVWKVGSSSIRSPADSTVTVWLPPAICRIRLTVASNRRTNLDVLAQRGKALGGDVIL